MSYLKRKYQHMAVGAPALAGAFFCLSSAGYIYNLNSLQTVFASPFLGASLSLTYFYFSEISRILPKNKFNRFSKNFSLEMPSQFISNSEEFIFSHKLLPIPITKNKFEKFCKIGCERQNKFFENSNTFLEGSNGFKKISKNEVWAENIFLRRKFISHEVKSCKRILTLTGNFHSWYQGSAGMACSDNYLWLSETSCRRWMKMTEKRQTSSNILRLLQTSIKGAK